MNQEAEDVGWNFGLDAEAGWAAWNAVEAAMAKVTCERLVQQWFSFLFF